MLSLTLCHQTLAVGLSHQGGPDPPSRLAQHALDLLGLGFGDLSQKCT